MQDLVKYFFFFFRKIKLNVQWVKKKIHNHRKNLNELHVFSNISEKKGIFNYF